MSKASSPPKDNQDKENYKNYSSQNPSHCASRYAGPAGRGIKACNDERTNKYLTKTVQLNGVDVNAEKYL